MYLVLLRNVEQFRHKSETVDCFVKEVPPVGGSTQASQEPPRQAQFPVAKQRPLPAGMCTCVYGLFFLQFLFLGIFSRAFSQLTQVTSPYSLLWSKTPVKIKLLTYQQGHSGRQRPSANRHRSRRGADIWGSRGVPAPDSQPTGCWWGREPRTLTYCQ